MFLPTVLEANLPNSLRIKLFLNPPDVNGNYPLEKKRMWHFSPASTDQLSLAPTINLFRGYFGIGPFSNLELFYFDGDEQMPVVKYEDLREACMFFAQCYSDYDNYQDFLKIYVKETLRQAPSPATAKFGWGTSRLASSLYKQLTTGRSSNVTDSKLEKIKIRVSKEFNAGEIQAEALDKSSIKCVNCKKVIKLGKPYNLHNFKKHLKRCSKNDASGTQSIATLFLAMTAVAQQVKSKAEEMIAECQTLKENGWMVDGLIISLQQVVEKPSTLDAVADDIKHQTLEAVESKQHPLYLHFVDLCGAGKVDIDRENGEDATTTSSSSEDEADDINDSDL